MNSISPNKSVIIIFLLSAFIAEAVYVTFQGKCPKAKPLKGGFDLKKYLGHWYVTKASEFPLEDFKCPSFDYTLEPNGAVLVNDSQIEIDGGYLIDITWPAKPAKPSNWLRTGSTPDFPSLDLWIIETDYTKYAVVLSCMQDSDNEYSAGGFILSRNPQLETAVQERLEKVLVPLGFENLTSIDQSMC